MYRTITKVFIFMLRPEKPVVFRARQTEPEEPPSLPESPVRLRDGDAPPARRGGSAPDTADPSFAVFSGQVYV